MADLIDRQKVLDAFKQICDRCGKYKQNNGVMCGACRLDDAISIVDDTPPVVDTDLSGSSFRLYRAAYDRGKRETMAGIIHCNECKHYQGVHGVMGHAPCAYWKSGGVLWDWFCSQGEKYERFNQQSSGD